MVWGFDEITPESHAPQAAFVAGDANPGTARTRAALARNMGLGRQICVTSGPWRRSEVQTFEEVELRLCPAVSRNPLP